MEIKLTDNNISFICVDLETTGLNPKEDCILEIGITITDKNLQVIDSFESIVWPTVSLSIMNEYVYNMHSSSGLLEDLDSSYVPSVDVVEKNVLNWLESHSIKADKFPMMGSSVHFDRAFLREHMPTLENFFTFMNIDISSLKQLVHIWDPDISWIRGRKKTHRALEDIEDTIDEASFYYNKFFNRSNNA